MKMWIARDKDGVLWLYESEPIRQGEWFVPTCFENSPMEVELVIKK